MAPFGVLFPPGDAMAPRPPGRALLRLRQRLLAGQQEAPLQVTRAAPSLFNQKKASFCHAVPSSRWVSDRAGLGTLLSAQSCFGRTEVSPVHLQFVQGLFEKPDLVSAPAQTDPAFFPQAAFAGSWLFSFLRGCK